MSLKKSQSSSEFFITKNESNDMNLGEDTPNETPSFGPQ